MSKLLKAIMPEHGRLLEIAEMEEAKAMDPLKPTRQVLGTWRSGQDLPDSDTTVLCGNAEWEDPVWPGYHDGEDWVWADGKICTPPPTWWMDFPEVPVLAHGHQSEGGGK